MLKATDYSKAKRLRPTPTENVVTVPVVQAQSVAAGSQFLGSQSPTVPTTQKSSG